MTRTDNLPISVVYVAQALKNGRTADELATELEITPRHVRRLGRLGGWTPAPRRHTGPRSLKLTVSPEIWAALEWRGGRSVEDTAVALLALVADKTRIAEERSIAEQGRVDDKRGGHWAAGYLDALVAGIERVR